MNRTVIAAAIAALVVGFGGGYIAANGIGNLFHPTGGTATATEPRGSIWSLFGHPRSADAARRGIPKPEGFAVWRTRLDTSGAQPLACVEMTRPLDPAKSYGDFVLVSPDLGAPPAVSVNPRNPAELCIGGVGFHDRQISLLKGLPGKGGETLAANANVDFTFGEKPPYVGFAGNGVILPRDESDGVGIETVNVTRLAIEVWRVPDRNLVRRSISTPDPVAEGEYAYEGDDSPDGEGNIVWKGEIAVGAANGDTTQRTTTVFPLGAVLREMRPGGYVIKARDISGGRGGTASDPEDESEDQGEPAQARRWVVFTDMALISYTGAASLDVVVRSLKTAKVLPNTRVTLVASNGETLAEGRTDASGRVAFPHALLEGEGAAHPKMVMAYGAQGDLAVLDLDRSPVDLSRQGVGGRANDDAGTGGRSVSDVDGFLYSDRGIYRPGEIVHVAALVRDRDARALTDRKGAIVIRRPSGVEFKRYPFTSTAGGAVAADVQLPRSAPRGRWTAVLEIEGVEAAAGDYSFSVEDFAPQRLAVTTDGASDRPMAAGEERAIAVTARFLYGAPGAGLQTQGEARLRVDPNPFPAFEGYRWGNNITPFEEKFIEIGSTVTDGEGKATLNLAQGEVGDTNDPLVASVTASVFEPGGRPVRESLSIKVRTQPLYLGVKVESGDAVGGNAPPVTLDIIAVNSQGQRVAANGVTYTLISENWDYDWFQQDGKWQWRRTNRDAVVSRGTINVAAGQPGRLPSRRLGYGDYRLEIATPDGAKTVTRFSPGWGGGGADATESPDFVRVTAGSDHYGQGDTIELTIKSPYPGEAQIAIATDRMIGFQTASVGPNGTTVRIKSTAAWGGGAYVMVTVVQPRDPVASPVPRRALGLIYVPLNPGNRALTVDIGTPAKIDSKATVDVPIQVRGLGIGQRARVTVAAVDEGILRLTRQVSPDPVGWYFGKRALGVDYRDDYGRLMDPNLGAPANVNFGADELGGEGLTVTPIKSVALWSGVVETGLDGRALVRLPAADFNGELRIMAVAWTDGAVGSGAKALVVRQPIVADLNLPRFLAPGDRATAILELHNVEGAAGDYAAAMTSDGGILAPFRKVFRLILGQRVAERIPFLAPRTAGIGNVAFTVTGPNNFTTTKTYPLQTRIGWGAETRATSELQQPGTSYTPAPGLLSGLAAGDVVLQVSYSPFRGFDPGPIALSLSRYPYGCTEQLISVAYPLLYAQEVATDPRLARVSPALSDAVGKLLDRQTLDGAFGLWRVGDGEADAWLGAYATDFMIEAQRRGAPVPQSAIDRGLNAMRQISRADTYASVAYRLEYPDWWSRTPAESKKATERMRSRASAYALYVLAKGGRGDLARLRWWHDVQLNNEASPLARAQIGAGLAMMGDKARARSAIRSAIGALGYRDETDWYQSPLRDLAGVIALAYEAGQPDLARSLQSRLENSVRDPDALNTQEQARLLQAAHQMLATAGPIRITATGAVPMAATGATPRWAVGRLADARFVNAGTGGLWRTVTVRGTPLASPPAVANGLSIRKELLTFTGQVADPASIRQGDRVIVLITGSSSQQRTLQIAINDALPAGFEIETTLGPDDAQSGPFRFLGELSSADVQESRDDRYVAAMDLGGGRSFAFAYVARAVVSGDFYLPGAEASDMYRPTINARSEGARAIITPAP